MIRNNFNRASTSYDSVAIVQRKAAEFLVSKLPTKNFDTILDLGTGTGVVVELLLKQHPTAFFTVNDISQNMLQVCRKKFSKNFSFVLSDMEEFSFSHHDLIISNLAMQWVKNLPNLLKRSITNSNVFAFSTLMSGTFSEWQEIVWQYERKATGKKYLSQNELIHLCQTFSKNFFFWTQDYSIPFNSPKDFMFYLRNLGANSSDSEVSFSTISSLLRSNQKFFVTYKVFFAVFC